LDIAAINGYNYYGRWHYGLRPLLIHDPYFDPGIAHGRGERLPVIIVMTMTKSIGAIVSDACRHAATTMSKTTVAITCSLHCNWRILSVILGTLNLHCRHHRAPEKLRGGFVSSKGRLQRAARRSARQAALRMRLASSRRSSAGEGKRAT